MHSRTDPRYKIVDRDNRLVITARRAAFGIERMIFSDLLPVSSSCFDLSEVGDESGSLNSSRAVPNHRILTPQVLNIVRCRYLSSSIGSFDASQNVPWKWKWI